MKKMPLGLCLEGDMDIVRGHKKDYDFALHYCFFFKKDMLRFDIPINMLCILVFDALEINSHHPLIMYSI